jgi:hypothetical protein
VETTPIHAPARDPKTMSVGLKLYEQITSATDDQARFQAVADAINALEQHLPGRDLLATKTDLSETELRLHK